MRMLIEHDDAVDEVSFSMDYNGSGNFNPLVSGLPADTFATALRNELAYVPSITMPPAIRYLSPDHSIVLWERPPGYVTFQFTEAMQEQIQSDALPGVSLRLPVPWQRYILLLSQDNKIGNLFLFFAQHEIRSLDDDALCHAPILNFYGNNRLCPASYTNIPQYEHTLLGAIEAAHDIVWNSGFNWDTVLAIKNFYGRTSKNHPLRRTMDTIPSMYRLWANRPLSEVMSWQWPRVYDSFNHFLTSGDLYHDYTGKSHDTLVKFVFAAQNAQAGQ